MRARALLVLRLLALCPFLLGLLASLSRAQRGGQDLALEGVAELPPVRGWLTQLALDRKADRLYVAAIGNDTVEVVDTHGLRHVRSLLGVLEPRGVAALEGRGRVWIASAATGELRLVETATGRVLRKLQHAQEAGRLWLSADQELLYAAFDSGALGACEADSGKLRWRVELGGHPEHLVLDEARARAFVSAPDARLVACIDLATQTLRWRATPRESATFPLVYDPLRELVLVAARKPERLLAYAAADGQRDARAPTLECGGVADDLHLDSPRGRIFASCGDGSLWSYRAEGAGWQVGERLETADGARASCYDAASGRLYLAVPTLGEQPAQVRVLRAAR